MAEVSAVTEKLRTKLAEAIAAGEPYEALQMYKARVSRAVAGRKWAQALELLDAGVTLLAQGERTAEALDLAQQLLTTVAAAEDHDRKVGPGAATGAPSRNATLELFLNAFAALAQDAQSAACFTFLGAAITHSARRWDDCHTRGSPSLHEAAAAECAARGLHASAVAHAVAAGDAACAAQTVAAWFALSLKGKTPPAADAAGSSSSSTSSISTSSTTSSSSGNDNAGDDDGTGTGASACVVAPTATTAEAGLFVTRCTLQFLCEWADVPEMAQTFADAACNKCEPLATAMRSDPLRSFPGLLAEAAGYRSAALFHWLRAEYARSLARDERLAPLFDRVGELHFGIKPERPVNLMSMVNDLLQGMMAPEAEA